MIKIAAVDSSVADKASADVTCDGVNDQTDITTALGVGMIEVFLFNGTYQIDAPIDLPNGAILLGNSVAGVKLMCNTASGVMRSSAPASRHEHVLVDSMLIGPGTHSELGCDLRGFIRSQFNRLRVYNFDLGVWFGGDNPAYESSWTNVFGRFYLSSNLVGFKLSGVDSFGNSTANQIMLIEGEIICRDATGGIAIDVVNGQILVDTCDTGYGNLSDGIVVRSGAVCSVINSRFEWTSQNSAKNPIRIKTGSFNNFFTGNSYSAGCTIPNVLDDNGVNARYTQLDEYSRGNEVAYGSAIFHVGVFFGVNPTFANGLYIPKSANSALAIATGTDASVFNVNTNLKITSILNGGSFRLFSDEFTTTKMNLDGSNGRLSLAGDILSTSAAPTVAPGTFAGTGATASVVGTNMAGLLTLTTGTGPGIGKVAGFTWSAAKPSANYALVLTPANAGAVTAMGRIYVDQAAATTAAASIAASIALAASSVYKFYYTVLSY